MCQHQPSAAVDVNTNSNFKEVVTKHTEIDVTIDFERTVLVGSTIVTFESRLASLTEIILDTSYLIVKKATINGTRVSWDLKAPKDANGSPLRICLDRAYENGEAFKLAIDFETTTDTTGLQWFKASQTDDKKYPFMFSQGEPVHARSMFPCQDTPSIKTTFDMTIRSILPVVASGTPENDPIFPPIQEPLELKTYKFKQEIPISNYLFAVASGNLAGEKIGPKSYVYCAPGDLEACKAEFKPDLQAIIKSAENLIFEYPWPLYNLVVLPKSFHLGGMENPVFNFYSATVVSGDRENIGVVAHEFAHSYSGNLVTNDAWEHFWLNEGWTVYIERCILRDLRGEEAVQLEAIVGWQDLLYNIDAYGGNESVFTSLVLEFQGKRPDDIMSKISYEKGYTFLCFLEQQVGREKWHKFVPHYFKTFFGKSVNSEQFKNCILEFFSQDIPAAVALHAVDWETWYHKPGAPPKPIFDSSLYRDCIELCDKWKMLSSNESAFTPSSKDVEGWTVGQLLVFLDLLIESSSPIPKQFSHALGSQYGLLSSGNLEVVSRFLRVALRAGDESVLKQTEEVLSQTGRMKFVKPLFEGLLSVSEKLAVELFNRHRDFYHPTCLRLLRNVLEKHGLTVG
ncbi:Leukotriene A-4 hydrolase [Colletotrichum fructicola]|uniref:Leucine aminopeptidase 2 n=1 Tax=Colletotrichum fructicola (strain Nara gc5) TaxID=1213859 RepID=L2FP36_COLFN|nr:Leukotriene A-4 hydrolase [Colletotrichum fructicola]KAE9579593.1 Leukotriene A-4 hydrolase [Colletotrichum fructicola]KAF4429190.1 Leucine aminopeptidase 2 [Colletotrichum fructicola]KAF4487094.1 Leucine aminopeptidase 2 [Colletotrichum fructicola Nara gc5]